MLGESANNSLTTSLSRVEVSRMREDEFHSKIGTPTPSHLAPMHLRVCGLEGHGILEETPKTFEKLTEDRRRSERRSVALTSVSHHVPEPNPLGFAYCSLFTFLESLLYIPKMQHTARKRLSHVLETTTPTPIVTDLL